MVSEYSHGQKIVAALKISGPQDVISGCSQEKKASLIKSETKSTQRENLRESLDTNYLKAIQLLAKIVTLSRPFTNEIYFMADL